MPVSLPSPDKLPPGPKRDLVTALHDLYDAAGRPSARKVADAAEVHEGELRDKVSHSTFLLLMRGELIPAWSKVEVVVLVLARWSTRGHDPKEAAAKVHDLWINCVDASDLGNSLRVAEAVGQLPPELEATYATLASERGFLHRQTWEELNESRRSNLVNYLCQQLESGEEPMTALVVAHNLNGNLSRGERTKVCRGMLSLRHNDSVDIRRKLAWDLRWMYSLESQSFLYEGLYEMLDDPDEQVVDSAHGSLGFVLADDVSDELWLRIDEKTTDFYLNGSPALQDAALFLYYKLFESDFGKLDQVVARERINGAMLSGVLPLQERALFAMAEVMPRLPIVDAVEQFKRTLTLLKGGPANVQQKVLDFWRVVFFKQAFDSYSRKKVAPEIGLALSEMVIDTVVSSLDSDYPNVRGMARSTLVQMGHVLPRSRHQQVLSALARQIRIDRGIDSDWVAEMLKEYVGEIPPELRETGEGRGGDEPVEDEIDDDEDWL